MYKHKALLFSILFLFSCQDNFLQSPEDTVNDEIESDSTKTFSVAEAMEANLSTHESPNDYNWSGTSAQTISLNGNIITASGTGVSIEANIATITAGGDYILSGNLEDGRIIVDSDDKNIVRLILDNATIHSTTNAPLCILNAEKTVVILADNSTNFLSDTGNYLFENPQEDEPNATLFSKDDLSIAGNGSLHIDANYNDGITSKDGLLIHSGVLHITSVDDGIRGKDYLVIRNGSITIDALGDALKSDNDEDSTSGYIFIEGGELNINSGADGIDAETDALISGGSLTIKTGGGSAMAVSGDNSAKGIKGNSLVVIDDGNFEINASDDALHSNSNIVINGGEFQIATADDAIHADASIVINDGSIDVSKCVEGIESNIISVHKGTIRIIAADDCFNSTAGTRTERNDNSCTYIYGGTLTLNASGGDGLDSNGNIVMEGGTVIIHGPSRDPEVMIDYNGTFKIHGGILISSGSASRMTQAPSSSSDQNSLAIMFRSSMSAATLFHIEDSNGNNVVTFKPLHNYQSIVYSSAELEKGKTFTFYTGGSCTGENYDGLYSGGTFTGGINSTSFTVSSTVTSIVK